MERIIKTSKSIIIRRTFFFEVSMLKWQHFKQRYIAEQTNGRPIIRADHTNNNIEMIELTLELMDISLSALLKME